MGASPVYAILGGTGSFGQAMTAYLLAYTDATIRIYSRGELLQAEMQQRFANDTDRLRFIIGDIRSSASLRSALAGVTYVFHAAALKHIDLLEYNPYEAVATNIVGTQVVAEACRYAGVQRAVLLSSDKAPLPTSTYGASKLVAERLWTSANGYSPHGTEYVTIRYGNVHGSRGSVVPKWRQQLLAGQPPTITSDKMTRFFLTLDEAVALAWFALHHGPRGHILIPHLPAYDLSDLVEAVIATTIPDRTQVSWMISGLRPGERLAETLMTEDEASRALVYRGPATTERTYAIPPQSCSWPVTPAPLWWADMPQAYRSDTWAWRLTVDDLIERLTVCDSGAVPPTPLCLQMIPHTVLDYLASTSLPASAIARQVLSQEVPHAAE